MEYDTRTYFDEEQYDDVNGFTLINAQDGKYHIAEKWQKEDGEDSWVDYWIPESELIERHTEGFCKPKGQLSDEQFNKVCQLVGWYTDDSEKAVVAN